jgi:GTP-binding protein Era
MADGPAAPRRCGLVAIVGRPNVGKSTLLNALVAQKISITSSKAQTTRHRITGVRTVGTTQFVFVDTPGFQTRHGAALNRSLNRAVVGALADVDVGLLVVEAGRFGAADASVLALVDPAKPLLLVANKLDLVARRADSRPGCSRCSSAIRSPSSCRWRRAAADVERAARDRRATARAAVALRRGRAHRRSDRFLAAEVVREKLFRLTGDELPYTSTVVIDRTRKRGRCAGSPRRSSSSATRTRG